MRKAILKVAWLALAIATAAAVCPGAPDDPRGKEKRRDGGAKAADKAAAAGTGDEAEYDVPPKLIRRVEPKYTAAAREAKIEGGVKCRLTVGTDGLAHGIEVTEGLDPGLDANAVEALRQWKFDPAQKDGKPAAVRANLVVTFHLK